MIFTDLRDAQKQFDKLIKAEAEMLERGELDPKNDVTTKAESKRFISSPGVYEVVTHLDEVKGNLIRMASETDAGERLNFTVFVNGTDGFDFVGVRSLLGYAGFNLPRNKELLNKIGVPSFMELLNKIAKKPFRVKVKAEWPRNTVHTVYITKGEFQLENDKGERITDESGVISFASREEAKNYASSQGLKVNDFLNVKIVEGVMPIKDLSESDKKPVSVQPLKPPSMTMPTIKPAPVAQEEDPAVPF